MNELSQKFDLLFSKIKTAQNILIVSHVFPDVDAISSVGAIIEVARLLNKKYLALSFHKEDLLMHYLPHEEFIHGDLPADFDFSNFDLIIALDCGSLSRTGLENFIKNKKQSQFIVEVDHHLKVDDYADLEIRLPEISSTAEVVFSFIKSQKIKITKNLANCLMAGILRDTGNFAYSSTTDTTIKIVSELISRGAQFPKMMRNFSQNRDFNSLKLQGLALDNLRINKKYNIGVSVLTKEDILAATGVDNLSEVNNEIFGEIVAFLSDLAGIKAMILLREEDDNHLKINLRTADNNVNVAKLAQIFSGGGHIKASGFLITGKIKKESPGWSFNFLD